MISCNFRLVNPFSDRWETVFYRTGQLSKNKAAELQVVQDDSIIGFEFTWTVGQDHAGISTTVSLLGYSVLANISDTRHWDDENHRWKQYD